jgi:hypothetical protein
MRRHLLTASVFFLAGLVVIATSGVTQARPSFGNSCKDCHGGGVGTPGLMEVDPTGELLDLGTQLDGKERGFLNLYTVTPGSEVTLSATAIDGDVLYAVQLKRLETGGQLNDVNNTLDGHWTDLTGWSPYGASPWLVDDDGADGGLDGNLTPLGHSITLFIDATTPLDVYDLEFALARTNGQGGFGSLSGYGDEHFYLEVVSAVPEPASASLAGLALIGLVWSAMPQRGRRQRGLS